MGCVEKMVLFEREKRKDGNPSDMVEIMKIAKKYNIPVIEDSAQCVLGYIDGQLVGTFGDMASWSFENKKHI